MYSVVKMFHDLQDNAHEYNIGDTYPREGYMPSLSRIEELATENNIQGVPLIVEDVHEDPDPVIEQGPKDPAPAKGKRKAKKETE